jgi:hypothetical protein
VLLHSLSHALITEIALECGYPASSLKERVYALSSSSSGPPDRCGILIYTATAGAQGTLGGLVAIASRFGQILRVRMIPSVPTMSQMTVVATGQRMGQPAMAACSLQRPAAR